MKTATTESAKPALHRTRNDLPAAARAELVALLNASLASAIDLHLQAKQAHWNVKGPSFFALHQLFDAVATTAEAAVDDLAERAVALGGIAVGTVRAVAAGTCLSAYPEGAAAGPDHVEALSRALAAAGADARAGIARATDLGDADTADLYTEISRAIDKQLWLVEAHGQAQR